MAQNLISTIICNDSAPTAYTAGDQIDVYYNDTTDVIEVELNGSPVTSGEDIYESYLGTEFTLLPQGYAFCLGSNLQTFPFNETFPYAYRDSNLDESCSGVICDLIKGAIAVVSATGAGVEDGSITVTASSSVEVRFDTTDRTRFTEMATATDNGDGSYTYTFSNYPPGTYSIYTEDFQGCKTSWIDVVIGINEGVSNYGVLQRWGYYGKEGLEHRVDLLQKGYSGSVTERDLMDATPTIRKVRGENASRLETIFPGEMDINVMSETDKEYLELIKTSTDKDLLVNFYIKPSTTYNLVFRGFVTTTLYSEPYQGGDYVSTLSINDRLGDLSRVDFLGASNNPLYGDLSVFEVIRTCLDKTDLDLGYRIAFNLYEASMDSPSGANGGNETGAATDDPLTQVFTDTDSYYTDGEPDDCYTVLEKVLKSINCEVRSYGGYWYIIYKPEKHTTYNYRQFDSEGNYESNSSISPQVDLKASTETNRATLLPWPSLQGDDIYNKVSIISKRIVKENIFTSFSERTLNRINRNSLGNDYYGWSKVLNGDTGSIDALYRDLPSFLEYGFYLKFNIGDGQGGNAYYTASKSIEYSGNDTFTIKIPFYFYWPYGDIVPPYVNFKYMVKVGTKYLDGLSGTWSGSLVINNYYITDINENIEIEITGTFDAVTVDTTEVLEVRVYDIDPLYYDYLEGTEGNLPTTVAALSTTPDVGTRIAYKITGTYHYYYFQMTSTGSTKSWVAQSQRYYNDPVLGKPSYPVFSSINFLTNPNGSGINNTDILVIKTTRDNVVNLDYEVDHFDLDTTINNSENLITNYFKLADGTPTSAWGSSSKKIQRIHGEQISGWYSQMAYRITGEITTDLHLTPYNVFREIADGNRIYTPVSMEIDDKRMKARIEMVELYNDETVTPSAFTSGFKQNAFR